MNLRSIGDKTLSATCALENGCLSKSYTNIYNFLVEI